MLQPGESVPAEASSSLASLAATATATVTAGATSAPAATTSAAAAAAAGKSGLSTGAIVGIVIGAVAVLALGGALFYFVGRTRTLNQTMHLEKATSTRNTGGDPGSEVYGKGLQSPYMSTIGSPRPANSIDGRWNSNNLPPYEHFDYKQHSMNGSQGLGVAVEDMGSVRSGSPTPGPTTPFMAMQHPNLMQHQVSGQQTPPHWAQPPMMYDARPPPVSRTPSEIGGEELQRVEYGQGGGLAAVHELDGHEFMSPEEAAARAED